MRNVKSTSIVRVEHVAKMDESKILKITFEKMEGRFRGMVIFI